MQSQDTASFGMVGESSSASHELGGSPQITGRKMEGAVQDIQKRVRRTRGKFPRDGTVDQLKKNVYIVLSDVQLLFSSLSCN